MMLIQAGLLILLCPALVAWGARKVVRNRNRRPTLFIIAGAAAIVPAWMSYAAWQADAIARAASFYVIPFVFMVALIPASIGFALADREEG